MNKSIYLSIYLYTYIYILVNDAIDIRQLWKKWGKNLNFTGAENGSCTILEREVSGKMYRCHVSETQQNKLKMFGALMLTLYMVTVNPGLFHLGPLIRE